MSNFDIASLIGYVISIIIIFVAVMAFSTIS